MSEFNNQLAPFHFYIVHLVIPFHPKFASTLSIWVLSNSLNEKSYRPQIVSIETMCVKIGPIQGLLFKSLRSIRLDKTLRYRKNNAPRRPNTSLFTSMSVSYRKNYRLVLLEIGKINLDGFKAMLLEKQATIQSCCIRKCNVCMLHVSHMLHMQYISHMQHLYFPYATYFAYATPVFRICNICRICNMCTSHMQHISHMQYILTKSDFFFKKCPMKYFLM